jgi:hypothetical protein
MGDTTTAPGLSEELEQLVERLSASSGSAR